MIRVDVNANKVLLLAEFWVPWVPALLFLGVSVVLSVLLEGTFSFLPRVLLVLLTDSRSIKQRNI